MYKEIKVSHSDANKKRSEIKKDGYISSVSISSMISSGEIKIPFTSNTFFTKASKLVQNSDEFTAIKFIVSGTVKWWYPKKDISRIVKAVTS